MDLRYSQEHQAFQAEVRQFLTEEWPGQLPKESAQRSEFLARFRRKATERGYFYRGIPSRFGGSEQPADVVRARIIATEFAAARAPGEVSGIGMNMVVPTLLEVGSEEQRHLFIPRTVAGEIKWAQGYSEPGSGSDLASLRSTAIQDGENWVINGHKIWTTRAFEADYMFALLRTEPHAPKHAGISYILLDFRQLGVTVRPIKQINGGAEFCEVFLENVRAPLSWTVGKRGDGWAVSKVNLKHERNAVGSARRSAPIFRSLVKLARDTQLNGRPAIEDPIIRDRLAAIDGYMSAQLCSGDYQLTLASRGESSGVLGMTNKIASTNLFQMISELASDIIGEAALKAPGPEDSRGQGPEKWNNQILGSLALSIAGGTSNIQRNIVAERGLGLPRDPSGS